MCQYPDVSLISRAREKRDEARRLVTEGVDPALQRLVGRNAKADTFAVIAAEWLALQRKRFAPATMEKAEWTFRDLVNPYLGNRPIAEIMPLELLNVFRRLEARGNMRPHTARNNTAAKSSYTPSLSGRAYVIQRRTYAVP